MPTTTKTSLPPLPYGRQTVTEEDIRSVEQVLRSDRLTQGEAIPRFERDLASVCQAQDAVLVSSGTAALHLSLLALRLGRGDRVITAANTFVASANCARYVGAEVIFADVDPGTGLMTPESLRHLLVEDRDRRVKAVIPVHFAGQTVELQQIAAMAHEHGAAVVVDGCHALGATCQSAEGFVPVGCGPEADQTVFSFHPVKHVAMGEGGAIVTDDAGLAHRLRRLRNHGLQREEFTNHELARDRQGNINPWYYELCELGFNYRSTDIQAALGMSQLTRLEQSVSRRNEIAEFYRAQIAARFDDNLIRPLRLSSNGRHAYHLFVVGINFERRGVSRAQVMQGLHRHGVGTQVHYIPVPWQPYYRQRYDLRDEMFPGAARYYERALSLPMYPALTDDDCGRVIDALAECLDGEDRR